MDLEWIGDTPRQVEVGDRIKLLNMPDDPNPIEPGTNGTVTSVDNRMDVVGVKWDNGRTLNLVLGVDSFDILNEGDKAVINKSMPKPTLKGKNVSKLRSKLNTNLKKTLQKSKEIKVEQDSVEGGKADKLTPPEIAEKHGVSLKDIQKEIELGIEIEMEHTNDPILAREITLDHLVEFPDYYSNKKHGLVSSEKKLEKFHENFFTSIGNAFGVKKNKDDQYDNMAFVRDLKKITENIKSGDPRHEEVIVNMIENFREKYKEHSMIDTVMKSLYHELRNMGQDMDETTSAGSSGAFSGPLFGEPIKKESRIIKLKDLLEVTTTYNSGDYTDVSETPFDSNKDGWFWNDKAWYEGGEVVDDIAQLDTNWKDELLNIDVYESKLSITKDELLKTVNLLESDDLSEAKKKKDKDIHKEKWKRCVKKVKKNSPDVNPYAVCTDSIGYEGSIKKKHRQKEGELDETTDSTSSGQYSTPIFAAKTDSDWKPAKKPIWKGGKIVQKIKNSGVLHEINKVKYTKDGEYVKLKDKCVKFNNQPWCSQGAIDKPLKLSKTTSDNISEVAKKLGVSENKIMEIIKSNLKEDKSYKLSLKDRLKIKLAGIDDDKVIYNLNNGLPIDWKGSVEGYREYIEGKKDYSGSN